MSGFSLNSMNLVSFGTPTYDHFEEWIPAFARMTKEMG
jgi:hypothetical protein